MTGASFVISYGDGSGANGTVGTDVVSIGGVEVRNQTIELATHVSESFAKDINSDGLLSLTFSQLNMVKPQKQMTFENVRPTLREPLFTAQLRRGSPGAFTFGYVDSTKYRGGLTWIPINTTTGFWQFTSQGYATSKQGSQVTTPGGQAIADTGTTLILADSKIVTGYYKDIPGAHEQKQAKGFVFPCNTTLPDLYLDIGGLYMARIHGADLNYSELNDGSSNCFGGLQAVSHGAMGIYGDIFFKAQFVVFNGGNNTFGMAPHSDASP